METKCSPYDIIFLDIETVPAYSGIEKLPPEEKKHWIWKEKQLSGNQVAEPGMLYERAGIYAEFGKIICICAGALFEDDGVIYLRLKTFSHKKEKDLLFAFFTWISNQTNASTRLCAHNGKEFDFPYLCRRLLIHGIPLPGVLNLAGKKPWEIKHIDTLELWKFGDYKHFTSLDLLAHAFGLKSPKENMNGSMVNEYYYRKKDLRSIRKYCEDDILTLVAVYLNMQGQKEFLPRHTEVERVT
jgi:hypothetical protein